MASFSRFSVCVLVAALLLGCCSVNSQLTPDFYDASCPNLRFIVRQAMQDAVSREFRMGASILRMFFHDCFVNGCDGSVLLDDTPTFTGEKGAVPNRNSLRGFEVIDGIKARVEAACPGTVSCADILALAARYGVEMLGGPTWEVLMGRRDARGASLSAVGPNIPSPFDDLPTLISNFTVKGLSVRDMVALSGSHTIGFAQCRTFRNRIYNDTDVNPFIAFNARRSCPVTGGDNALSPLDFQSPNRFDNVYYSNLMAQNGLLHSDQQLFSGGVTDSIVRFFFVNEFAFRREFADAMVRMGSISPLTGSNGEIRGNCRRVN